MSASAAVLHDLLTRADQQRKSGRYRCAQALLDQAYVLAARPDADSWDILKVDLAQGFVHQAAGEVARAEQIWRQALARTGDNDTAPEAIQLGIRMRHALGAMYRIQGRYPDAEEQLRQALALAYAHLDPKSDEIAGLLNELGITFKYCGKFAEAIHLYNRALEILHQRIGPDHPLIATIYHNLGGLAHASGNFAAAEPLARRAVTIRERALGPDHPGVAADRAALAPILDALGQHEEAEQLLQQALEMHMRVNDQYEIGVSLNNLAAIRYRRHDLHGAQTLLRRALTLKQANLGAGHPELAPTLNNLGVVLQALGDLPGAQALYAQAVAILETAVERTHPTLLACRAKYAALSSFQPDGPGRGGLTQNGGG